MLCLSGLSVALALALVPGSVESLKEGECEVCVTFLGKFYQLLKDSNTKFNSADIETALVSSCKDAKGKENRFCYYIGATSDAATKMINEVSKPLSSHVPVDKVCEKLKKKDSQICELRYEVGGRVPSCCGLCWFMSWFILCCPLVARGQNCSWWRLDSKP
ncbi:unnamed protein product [Menidia menidia]|uniref:(Atlantic silverside) hypothetical protein n=1 Tax=Menidia menidia TaxID=238744 RepID=A0A8S4BER6_9TELE|nr:unnamed protein product [Menidia menidia]